MRLIALLELGLGAQWEKAGVVKRAVPGRGRGGGIARRSCGGRNEGCDGFESGGS